jgi:hypothetical protein
MFLLCLLLTVSQAIREAKDFRGQAKIRSEIDKEDVTDSGRYKKALHLVGG